MVVLLDARRRVFDRNCTVVYKESQLEDLLVGQRRNSELGADIIAIVSKKLAWRVASHRVSSTDVELFDCHQGTRGRLACAPKDDRNTINNPLHP